MKPSIFTKNIQTFTSGNCRAVDTGRNKNVLYFSLCLVLMLLLNNDLVFGQVTQIGGWTKAYDQTSATGNGTSFSIPNASNRILIVAIAVNSGSNSGTVGDPTTITYGGVTLTKATGNGATNGRMHTWLYFLKDNAVMDNTSRPLNVTMGTQSQTLVNFTVWYAIFAGVNQQPVSYTVGDNLNNNNTTGPVLLSTAMTINANEQAISVTNILNNGSNTVPVTTIASNWTSGGVNSVSNTNAYKVEVSKRSIPVTNASDNVSTSITSAGTNYRWAISAISLPGIPAPTITGFLPLSACTGSNQSVTITGTNFTGVTAVNFSSIPAASFTVDNATQITAILPSGAVTGQISVTKASTTVTSSSSFTINPLPLSTVGAKSDVTCFSGSDGSIQISASGGSTPYSYSVNGGTTWTPSANNPYTFGGLQANVPYRIKVRDSNGCISK